MKKNRFRTITNIIFIISILIFLYLLFIFDKHDSTTNVILNDIEIKQTIIALPQPQPQPGATKVKPK